MEVKVKGARLGLPLLELNAARYPWYVLGTVCLGTFTSVMDQGTLNAAYPSLAAAFGTPVAVIGWVGMAYLITSVTLLTVAGRSGDIVGRKQVYVLGYVVFLAGSLLAALAPDLGWLLVARVICGAGAAMLMSSSIALIGANVPAHRRGLAIGILETTVALALAVGPIVGGLLTELLSWRAIFFMNWPGALVGLVLACMVLREPPRHNPPEGFDFLGAAVFGLGVVSLLLGLTTGSTAGWGSPAVLVAFGLALCLLTSFVFIERRVKHPMIDLSLFANPVFAAANLAKTCCYVSMKTALFMAPFYFQRALGFVPAQIGLALTPVPIALRCPR